MFARSLRGSIFLSLMLIVSMTLTGCSFDIGSIISGLQNVIGDIGGKLGGFIEKGMGFAKDFIGKAKEFVGPLVEKGKEIFEEISPIAEKITDGIEKVEDVVDKVSDTGNSIKDFAEGLSSSGKDSAGDDIDTTAPTSEIMPDPNSETSEIVISPDDDDVAAAPDESKDEAANEVVDSEELQEQAKAVMEGTQGITDGVKELSEQLKKIDISDAKKAELEMTIESIKSAMAQIKKDPTSKEAKALFEKAKADVDTIVKEAKKYGEIAKGTVDSLKAIADEAKDSFNSFNDAMASIKSIFN